MVGFLRIVFFTYLNLVLCNSCDPNHGTEGMYDCVRIPSYNGYQWAVCLSSQSLRIHTSGHMSCQGSNFCWLSCTQSIYPKSKSGHIPKECKCDPVENERRKRSLIAKGRESKVKVSSECYVPAFKSNCQWYSKCLETHSSCEASDFQYAISYGKAICSIFLEDYNSFSEDGKSWIRSSQKCIEDRLRSLLMPNNTLECRNIRDRGYQVHSDCYFRNSNPRFCNLLGTDQQKIYWSIKQLYEHAFYEKFDEGMAQFRSCLRNGIYTEQRKFMFYVEKEVNQYVDENTFASELAAKFAFSSHGLDWDVDKIFINKRNAYKSEEYQIVEIFVSKRQVEMAKRTKRHEGQFCIIKALHNEYNHTFMDTFKKTITDGIRANDLKVLEIGFEKQRIAGLAVSTDEETSLCFYPIYECVSSQAIANNLPGTPKAIDTKFYLHKRGGKKIQLKFLDKYSFKEFDTTKKTFVIIHGFRSSGNAPWVLELRDSILDKEDANVIVVDWERGAKGIIYNRAAVNTEIVGIILALLVRSLDDYWGTSKTYIHIIGHSLGAHIAGFSGNAHKKTRYDRITGLDPAGPYFMGKGRNARLDETDALFVDVIHTNGLYENSWAPLWDEEFGYLNAIGHLDFYPNGGQFQPGCSRWIRLFKNKCSHSRAHSLFIDSILPDRKFMAWKCESLRQCQSGEGIDTSKPPDNRMGFYTDDSKKNEMYYLETNNEKPYDKH